VQFHGLKLNAKKGIFMEQLYSPFCGSEVEGGKQEKGEKMEVGKQGKNPTYPGTQSVTHISAF